MSGLNVVDRSREESVMYVNVGVRWAKTGERMPTKKALKDAIGIGADLIEFDSTSPLQDGGHGVWTIELLQQHPEVKLNVVGPDPYTKRVWYATVEINSAGVVRVR